MSGKKWVKTSGGSKRLVVEYTPGNRNSTVKCDPAMKQFLLHLDETNGLGRKFVVQDLDETHIFIASDILPTLSARIDDLMDKLHFPMAAQ